MLRRGILFVPPFPTAVPLDGGGGPAEDLELFATAGESVGGFLEIGGGIEEDFAVAFDEEGVLLGFGGSFGGGCHFGVDKVGEEGEGSVYFFGEVGFFFFGERGGVGGGGGGVGAAGGDTLVHGGVVGAVKEGVFRVHSSACEALC